jgi:hypothetical protein
LDHIEAGVPPSMYVVKIAVKNINVNDSENFAFATSHFAI